MVLLFTGCATKCYFHRSKPEAEYSKGTYVSTDSNPAYGLSQPSQSTTATSPATAKQDTGDYELCDVQDKDTQEALYEDV